MTPGLKHALFDYWWAWDHEQIRKSAVLAGFFPHFVAVVGEQFEKNRSEKPPRVPFDWPHLEVLRSRDTLRRLQKGERTPPFEFLLGLAAFLRIDPGAFFPSPRDWIADAAYYLAAPRVAFPESDARRQVGFDRTDARVYADAVLSHPPSDRAVTQGEIDGFLFRHPLVVRTVAECLGPRLAVYYATIKKELATGIP